MMMDLSRSLNRTDQAHLEGTAGWENTDIYFFNIWRMETFSGILERFSATQETLINRSLERWGNGSWEYCVPIVSNGVHCTQLDASVLTNRSARPHFVRGRCS